MATFQGGGKENASYPMQHSAFPRLVSMWRAGKGCDVTIMCKDDKTINAHSLVLCSVSDKLDELLLLNADKMITSSEVDVETWEALLELIYTGQWDYSNEPNASSKLNSMLNVARSLGMEHIEEHCESVLKEISLENHVEDAKPEDIATHGQTEDIESVQFVQIADADDGQKTSEAIPRKKRCFHCKDKCKAKKVKCLYCFRIVLNDVSHMDTCHPFTPASSIFAYNCRFIGGEDTGKDSIVFTKIVAMQCYDDGTPIKGSVFQCQRCDTQKQTLDEIMKHTNTDHGIVPKVCKICHTGFLRKVFVKDHENFCKGGDLLKCEECGKEVGGHHALWSHLAQHRQQGKTTMDVSSRGNLEAMEADSEEELPHVQDETKVSPKSIRLKVCVNCQEACQKKWVKCLYCERIVFNSTRHMDQIHPFTPKDCIWAYYCKYSVSNGGHSKVSHIFSKEVTTGNASIVRYVCQMCKVSYKTTNMILKHLKQKHEVEEIFQCSICEMGFNSLCQLNNHGHFCKGGDMSTFSPSIDDSNTTVLSETKSESGRTRSLRRSIKKPVRFRESVTVLDKVDDENDDINEGINSNIQSSKSKNVNIGNETPISCDKDFSTKDRIEKGVLAVETTEVQTPSNEKSEEVVKGSDHVVTTQNESSAGSIPSESSIQDSESTKEKCLSNEITMVQQSASEEENRKMTPLKKKIKVEHDEDLSHGVCCVCGNGCKATTVRCMYCFKVVDRDIVHKEIGHPHSPVESLWIYSCQLEVDEKYSQSMIFIKESIHKKPTAFRKTPKQGKTDRFKCLQCDNNFTSMEILLKHVVQQFRCLRCKLIFTNKDSVLRHVELNHNQMPFMCETCECGFVEKACWEDHSYLCSGGGQMSCGACSLNFWRKSEFKKHKKQCHQEETVKQEKGREDETPHPVVEDTEDDDDYDPTADTESEDPLYTVEDNWKTKIRGRGRKRKRNGRVPIGSLGQAEESLKSSLSVHFEEIPCERVKAHQKMCLMCEERCHAEAVKCGYCGVQVKEPDMDAHMSMNHPMVPATSLWPVTCRCYRVNSQSDHLARQIIEQQLLHDENNKAEEEGGFVTNVSLLAGYECVICDEKCGEGNILQHLTQQHKVEAFMCETCGLVMKVDGKINIHDHKHMCAGGDILKCKECDKRFASWHSASKHYKLQHVESKRTRVTTRSLQATKVLETHGDHGYLIKCVDCDGTCHTGDVKCGLCLEIVPKNDLHMKLKHAYSPTSTWVVTCRYSIPSSETQIRGFAGGKVAACDQADLLGHNNIPCTIDFHYKCWWCDMLFSNKKQFKEHVRMMHYKTMEHKSTGIVVYYCKHCEAVLIGRSYFFSDHVQFCSKGEVFKCEMCQLQFCNLQKKHLHTKKMHPEILQERKALKAAENQSNGKVPIDIPRGTVLHCAECPYTTENLTLLKRHNRMEHKYRGGQLHQICRFCFQVFRVRSDRERHEQSVHLGGQEVVCHICGQSYEIPNQLERHIYYYHKGGREYLSIKQKEERKKNVLKACKYCGKEYTIASKLNRHIRVVHEKSLEYKCSICHKEFSSKDCLRIHENKHKGNKPYNCPYCTYKDYKGYMVNSHVEKEHPGQEKPFKRVMVFQDKDEVQEEPGVGYEPQQLVVEYVNATEQEVDYTQAATEVIQLQNYAMEESEPQHQFMEVVQKYEVQQECSEVEIPAQQIEVKEIAVDNLEEVTTAGEVLMEYYVT